jgi:hypothetical protein
MCMSVCALLITYSQDCSLSSGGGRRGGGRGWGRGGSSREGETRPIIRYRRSVGNLIAAYHGDISHSGHSFVSTLKL